MATREDRHQLYQALSAHKVELEIIRGVASVPDLEALDRRIEAARLLLEWKRELSSLSLRFPHEFKRRHHQALQLIRIKFRRRHLILQRHFASDLPAPG
jgi:hypothetical protein